MLKLRQALALIALVAAPALAQNTPIASGTRVQGEPDGRGDPVQVTIVGSNGADTTLAVTTTPAVTGNGTAATAQRVTIASDSTGQVTANGNVASGATDSGNPVKIGCKYSSTLPTFTDGQRADCQIGSRGSLSIQIRGVDGAGGVAIQASNADGGAVSASNDILGLNKVYNGSTVDKMRGDTNGTVTQPGLSTTFWYYTSGTSPILSNTTTAVTIKTAAGASVRNYIDSCEISSTALGASVPLAIRDGAGGTVIWALRPPTAGWLTPVMLRFSPPLRSTANTLLEIVTTTTDTSGTFDVNCQGHTGS